MASHESWLNPVCRLTLNRRGLPQKRWLALSRKGASHLLRGVFWESIAVLILTGAAACADIQSRTDSFGTLDEARAAGALEQGWLPDGLPPGTREIRIAHVPRTARRWGIINFPSSEASVLKAMLAPEAIDVTGIVVDIPARIEWWPVVLRGTLDAEKVSATGLRVYRSRKNDLVFAVNWNQGRAYYWPAG